MKYIAGLIVLIGFSFQMNAQFGLGGTQEKDSCYFRWVTVKDGDSVKRVRMSKNQMRYAEWECGKQLGVVDCNNELSWDEETNIVFKKNIDLVNVAGGNKPFTGTCESCFMNGRVERRVTFVNGKENGTDTTFYESGCPQVIRAMVQGQPHGQWLYHYDSTEFLAWEMNYYMNEKEGRQIYFAKPVKVSDTRYRSDTIKVEHYKAGVLHGVKKTYYKRNRDGEGGSVKREANYVNGLLSGSFKLYNLDRQVIEEVNYKEGKKDQICTYYYDDGTLLKTENWSMGMKNGEFTTLFYQGQLQKTENYKNDVKEGWFNEFYPDETPKHKTLYSKGVLIEEYKYDEHGREIYSFPKYAGGGDEDDAVQTTKSKEANKEKFLKAHKKRMMKEAKKKAKAEAKLKKQQEKEKKKKAKEAAKAGEGQ